jgi:hypothetical protein
LDYVIDWFLLNGLVLNITKYTPDYCQNESFQITYQHKVVAGTNNIKFLGLALDININYKNHVYRVLPKISSVCCLVRVMYPHNNTTTLTVIYFVYVHAVMQYGVILWRNSVESQRVFQQQKKNN